MDFFYDNKITQPKKGSLLISEPYLPDPNFERTVVLLCAHNEEGSFGFVINKPSILKYADIVQDDIDCEELVYMGGPVQQDTLHFLHCRPDIIPDGVQIWKDVYWGGNFEQVKVLLDSKAIGEDDIRFFIGYSGWGPGQLQVEMDEKSWIIAQSTNKDYIFSIPSDQVWKNVLQQMGGTFKMISNYPRDPRLN
jgi:putative transcriptional regulator